jgi:anti-anti-sigma factor
MTVLERSCAEPSFFPTERSARMSSDSESSLSTGDVEGILTLRLTSLEITPETAEELYKVADSLAGSPTPRRVVLNMATVEGLKSVGIGILIQFQTRVKKAGGELKLCRVGPEVKRTLALVHADQMFDTRDTEQDASDAFLGRSDSSQSLTKRLSRWFG